MSFHERFTEILKAVFEMIRIAYESRKHQAKFLRQAKMELTEILLFLRKNLLCSVISNQIQPFSQVAFFSRRLPE